MEWYFKQSLRNGKSIAAFLFHLSYSVSRHWPYRSKNWNALVFFEIFAICHQKADAYYGKAEDSRPIHPSNIYWRQSPIWARISEEGLYWSLFSAEVTKQIIFAVISLIECGKHKGEVILQEFVSVEGQPLHPDGELAFTEAILDRSVVPWSL